jgi:hypothetical protein
MNTESTHKTGHSDAAQDFGALEVVKSNLLLEAQALRARGLADEAAVKFAQAAEMEEWLSEACLRKGLTAEAWLHRFSAVGCWAQAGNVHEAISLGDDLLRQPTLPPRLRQEIETYSTLLRRRRAVWSAELALTGTDGG